MTSLSEPGACEAPDRHRDEQQPDDQPDVTPYDVPIFSTDMTSRGVATQR